MDDSAIAETRSKPTPRFVKTDTAILQSRKYEDTANQIFRGFSPANVKATDFPFDCNRAVIELQLLAKAANAINSVSIDLPFTIDNACNFDGYLFNAGSCRPIL